MAKLDFDSRATFVNIHFVKMSPHPMQSSSNASGDPVIDSGSRVRRRKRSLLSLPCLFGIISSKRLSLVFALLNLFAFLNFWNLVTRTHLEMKKNDHLEHMIRSYQFQNKSERNETISARIQRMSAFPAKMERTAQNHPISNADTPDIPITNSTKILEKKSQQQERRNKNNNSTRSTPGSDSVSTKKDNRGNYAYAFLIGGALSKKEGTDYRGGLFGVVVAAHSLRRQGSNADVVLMVQISATTNATTLPEHEELLLQAMKIRLVYLPKVSHNKLESFYSLMMEKFRILQMEEYSRVLFLDADILPMCNLDYIMKLSEEGNLLKENVVVASKGEPASGGFFVLKPNVTDYLEVTQIIQNTEKKYFQLEYPHWDPIEGWGHVIDESDVWKSAKRKSGTNWDFYGAQADQGLLYYWTKYYKKSVSIINRWKVEQWGTESGTDELRLLGVDSETLGEYVCRNSERELGSESMDKKTRTPYMNYIHYTGRSKPWYKNRANLEKAVNPNNNETTDLSTLSTYEYWFWLLQDALGETGLRDKISLDFITAERKAPALGKTPSFDQRAQYIARKAANEWHQYEYEEYDKSKPRPVPTHITDTRKWAYAFILGGARSESEGTEYIAGLYSIVAVTHELRKLGSIADFVLMVQIATESPHETLTDYEEDLLRRMNIKIVYIPKFASPKLECFYSLMLEKFRILSLTDYSRVMYMDYDVMPTCNLDYLFDLSDPLIELSGDYSFRLKENVILSYRVEPSAGGIFILKPDAADYDRIQRIITEKEQEALKHKYPHWNPHYGWGHVITPPDYWKDIRGRIGTNWTWYGAEADQGLLYYWTKYVKKSVSIITRDDVEQWDADNWETNKNGTLVLRPSQNKEGEITTIVKNAFQNYGCAVTHLLPSPYNDFFHLTGRAKPWYQTQDYLENPDCTKKHARECKIKVLWYNSLKEALHSVGLLDDFSWEFLGTRKLAPLGNSPGHRQIAHYMKAKRDRKWNQYRNDIVE